MQDGIVYASNWNEGLVILDVGNGIKGGSPSNPQLIAQYKYDLNELYRDVAQTAGLLTPVPGGVGPVTVSMLLRNTVIAARMQRGSA